LFLVLIHESRAKVVVGKRVTICVRASIYSGHHKPCSKASLRRACEWYIHRDFRIARYEATLTDTSESLPYYSESELCGGAVTVSFFE
jgi:hypothetical protein